MANKDGLAARLIGFYRIGVRECFRFLWTFYGGQPTPEDLAQRREQAMWDAWEKQLRDDAPWPDREAVGLCPCPRCRPA